ncbi:hypothetical protein QBC34DRAFT_164978 [Podospora aff. communis PSN243]|uniref:Protein kinase domain-containing protein n=1 Tax=Podospora aff. communis PSN243 TaxID=3040156 RepID=A0AAV9G987_9PEZI|nr:hypothetical protein QBC34DRAFT_164978 [Podospora aff. communis PSN243]
MPEAPITNKDDVQTTIVPDTSTPDKVRLVEYYTFWVSGSVDGEDTLYMGKIEGSPGTPPSEHSLEKIKSALSKVKPDHIFPPLPFPWKTLETRVTVADDWDEKPQLGTDVCLKRPPISDLKELPVPDKNDGSPSGADRETSGPTSAPPKDYVARLFAHEIKQLERLKSAPAHPNILGYHGCRVRNGRVTGILLDRVAGCDLFSNLQDGGTIDKEPFFAALSSAIDHLHNVVGLVHNNIKPTNITVGPDGAPTLIDFSTAFPDGEEMSPCAGVELWGDDPLDMDPETIFVGPKGGMVSRKSRDVAALNQLRTWVDHPVAELTEGQRKRLEMLKQWIQVGQRRHKEAVAREAALKAEAAPDDETQTRQNVTGGKKNGKPEPEQEPEEAGGRRRSKRRRT